MYGHFQATRGIKEKLRIFEQSNDLTSSQLDGELNNENIESNMISNHVSTDSQGLIVPKKLVNPCLESMERQNLHREMLFNQKIGKPVLNQKTELQRALEKQKERHVMAAQQESKQHSLGGELEKVIMERAQRLEGKTKDANFDKNENEQLNEEYLKVRNRLQKINDMKYA